MYRRVWKVRKDKTFCDSKEERQWAKVKGACPRGGGGGGLRYYCIREEGKRRGECD